MHTNTHICTYTYAITISENEARKLKESKKRDMKMFIGRNEKREMLQLSYNIKNNKGIMEHFN